MSDSRPYFLAALALGVCACSIPDPTSLTPIQAPSEAPAEWTPVADYLDHRCGSLDCHGDLQRNFIIYSCDGLRLSPTDLPLCPPGPYVATTAGEYDSTYRSLVGLEPAVMSAVVSGGGQDPDQLTFVRKARGEEAHKGGALIVPGDAQDQCITSWLAGSTNTSACTQAIASTQ